MFIKKKQIYLNLILSFIAFAFNYSLNFFLTPYISAKLPGTYGYVKLANDIVAYAALVTSALNSMASRFISIELNKGNREKAKDYYSSVMYANIVFCIVLAVPLSYIMKNIHNIFQIPAHFVADVRVLFFFSFASFLVSLVFSANAVAAFAMNRLDLSYYVEVFSYAVRGALIILLFACFNAKVYYVSLTGFVVSMVLILGNLLIKKYLMSDIKMELKRFDIRLIFQIMSAGIWNTILKLGNLLLDGVDLMISNLWIGAVAMNDLSFAKTIPGIISSLLGKFAGVFMPNYTILYAQGKTEELKSAIKSAMITLSVIVSIPIGIIIAYVTEFYSLWIPNENIEVIAILSTMSCIAYAVSAPLDAVYNLFTVVNKVRPLALSVLISGVVSSLSVLTLVNVTNLGVFAVVPCSVITGIIRNIFFVAPYAAKMLGFHKMTFLPEIAKSCISVMIVCGVSFACKQFIQINGWITFFFACAVSGGISFLINIYLLLNGEQKRVLFQKLRGFLHI